MLFVKSPDTKSRYNKYHLLAIDVKNIITVRKCFPRIHYSVPSFLIFAMFIILLFDQRPSNQHEFSGP